MAGLVPRGDRDEPRLPYRPRGSRACSRCGRGAVRREARHPQPRAALPRQAAPWANLRDPWKSDPQPHLRIPRSPRRGHQPALRSSGASPVPPDPGPPPTEPEAVAPPRLSSTARYPRPSRPDWMLRPPRPPPVSRRSRGLWTVALGSFPLPPTWPSSPALHARDRRRLLQKLPHCQPALGAASFHRGWKITRSPACPSAGEDDPG